MRWRDVLEPARMARVAIVAPSARMRRVLVEVADSGLVEPERFPELPPGPASQALERARRSVPVIARSNSGAVSAPAAGSEPTRSGPVLMLQTPDIARLEQAGDVDLLAGEADLEQVRAGALEDGSVGAVAGWCPSRVVSGLSDRLASNGGAVVRLEMPRGDEPPTQMAGRGAAGAFQPLVDTYATVAYRDINPSIVAGVAYMAMFGMMFGDAGDGALLVAAGVMLWLGYPASLKRLRWAGPFLAGGGLASIGFGFAYGEAFGPTGLVPVLWLRPLANATELLAVAVAAGAGLLAVSYVLGTVNRWREGGVGNALLAVSGAAGIAMYLGIGVVGLGWYRHLDPLMLVGGVLAGAGGILGFAGFFAQSAGSTGGAVQAGVEMFDAVVRLGTNTVSFARLAAFGLTHAALGSIVWSATAGLWHRGGVVSVVASVVVFAVGTAVAFALEALVAGVQALRLEYYELFSRIFDVEGRPFRPWHVPTYCSEEVP